MDLKEQYDKIFRYCYLKTKDRYLAEDITQETFLRFWESKTYRDTGKEIAYLYTIARNLCVDEFRRAPMEDIDAIEEKPDGYGEKSEGIAADLDICNALDKLPEELREIIILRYINGLSSAEIGKMLGISRFAVYRRVKEGLGIMKKILQEGE